MKLIKFRSLQSKLDFDRVAATINSNEFWHDNRKQQNDVFEMSPIFNTDFSFDEFSIFLDYLCYEQSFDRNRATDLRSKWLQDQLDKNSFFSDAMKMKTAFTTKIDNFGICSFSSADAISNPRLWGTYAGGGTGIAIETDLGKLKPNDGIFKVTYKKSRPIISLSEYIKTGFIAESRTAVMQKVLATKSRVWIDEHEIRHVSLSANTLERVGTISKVIFGPKSDRLQAEKNVLIAQIPGHIQICEARPSDASYDVKLIPYSSKKRSQN